jgi:hypothetical protein
MKKLQAGRRIWAVAATSVAVIAIPGSVAFAGWSGTAGAAGTSSVVCAKTGGSATGTITLGKCTPKSKTNKSASFSASALESGSGTVTWASSGQTTVLSNVTSSQVTPNLCKKGSVEYKAAGNVTGGTSTYTHVGDAFTATVCISTKTLKISNLKGTTTGI